MSPDPQDSRTKLFSPARLGPVTLRNRTVKCATFETMTPGGMVSDDLITWHRRFAEGGVGMCTLAYCAVSADGLTFRDQIRLRSELVPDLRRFCDAIHAEGAAAAVQLGHAGWFADPRATTTRPVGPSAQFSPKAMQRSRAATAADLDRLCADYAGAATFALEAGFDALEVHVGHGYLLSQFLSPYNNRRRDEYGGSVENRARFPRRAVRAVRDAVGDRAAVYLKLNMDDGFSGGLQLEDGIGVARLFEADGAVDAIQLTGGHTTRTPMYLMRGDNPVEELASTEKSALRRLFMRAVLRLGMRRYDFSEAFFRDQARRFLAELATPLMLLGGINELDTMVDAIDEGFAFVALGRALIRDPDLVKRLEAGETTGSRCVHCNLCIGRVGTDPTVCAYADAPA